MTINKDDFYLQDVELLKLLQPILKRKGIEPDGGIVTYYNGDTGVLNVPYDYNFVSFYNEPDDIQYPTWRKDSLEAALPEWCFDLVCKHNGECWDTLEIRYPRKLVHLERKGTEALLLFREILIRRGELSLKALAELIILLDKEDIN